ncbi:MAG: D-alanine--D-alanine ligase family protein [Turicibacter sp.]
MKLKVGVFFGGESVEHEISIISANQAMHAINKDIYEVVPVYLSKKREWYTGEALLDINEYKNMDELFKKCQRIVIVPTNGKIQIERYPSKLFGNKVINTIDVAIPVIHGTNGEDGALQGFFELNGIPYSGCDVGAAAVGQDKVYMKNILRDSGLPITNYVWYYSSDWYANQEACLDHVESKLVYPLIIKPANLGSSVGISKAADRESLEEAIVEAINYDNKIIIEEMVTQLVEVNCSVIGDFSEAKASVLEEVMGSDEFLSFRDKYQGGSKSSKGGTKGQESQGMASTNRIIPARLTDEGTEYVRDLALKTFRVLGSAGVARIDFLINAENNEVYVNEINTIPGSLSFYLWEKTDRNFTELMTSLVELALKRQRDRENLTFSFDSNVLALQGGGTKGAKGTKGN